MHLTGAARQFRDQSYLKKNLRNATSPPGRARKNYMERETGFEPATSTLARSHSTTELLPLSKCDYKQRFQSGQTSTRGATVSFISSEIRIEPPGARARLHSSVIYGRA